MEKLQEFHIDKKALIKELSDAYYKLSQRSLDISLNFIFDLSKDFIQEIKIPSQSHSLSFHKARSLFLKNEFKVSHQLFSDLISIQSDNNLYNFYVYNSLYKNIVTSSLRPHTKTEKLLDLKNTILKNDSTPADPFLLLILSKIFLELKDQKSSKRHIIESLVWFPCNWEAWLILSKLCSSLEELEKTPLRKLDHWMVQFFLVEFLIKQTQNKMIETNKKVLEGTISMIEKWFPSSSQIILFRARFAALNRTTVNSALVEYKSFFENEKINFYSLEHIPEYSDLLFLTNDSPELFRLCTKLSENHKNNYATCFAIGNYYSLHGLPEKALVYFRRSIYFNPQFINAFTLCGQCYLELEKFDDALDFFEQAFNINQKDVRDLVCLGKTHGILGKIEISSYYYNLAFWHLDNLF